MELIETIRLINYGIAVLFFLCYFYQFVYIPVPFLKRDKPHRAEKLHRYAVLICGRNEEKVIGYLVAKEIEFTAVRVIMAGRMAGISGETIRERLRESYV